MAWASVYACLHIWGYTDTFVYIVHMYNSTVFRAINHVENYKFTTLSARCYELEKNSIFWGGSESKKMEEFHKGIWNVIFSFFKLACSVLLVCDIYCCTVRATAHCYFFLNSKFFKIFGCLHGIVRYNSISKFMRKRR